MSTQTLDPVITANNVKNTMTTLSGKVLDLKNPDSTMIDIEDIAAGLANNSHFAGQTPYFFSIAQHCIMVCDEYVTQNPTAPANMKLLALMHDAAEAYVGDVIKPLKVLLPYYSEIEKEIMMAIAARYDLPIERMAQIKSYDIYIQNIEYNCFYRNQRDITYFDPETARRIFIDMFNEYYHEAQAKKH